MKYIKEVKDKFEFLKKELGYEIQGTVDLKFFKYVRYQNITIRRLISIHLDLTENYFDVSIWKLTAKLEELDSNCVDLSELCMSKKINEQLIELPANAINKDLSEWDLDKILAQRVAVLKKHFFSLLDGSDWA